jgi:hypothetical protein
MSKANPQPCSTQTITHKGAQYIVTARYTGHVTFLDLLKQLVKRDIEEARVKGSA